LALAGAATFWFVLDRPYGDAGKPEMEFVVKKGDTGEDVAIQLEEAGLIKNKDYFARRHSVIDRIAGKLPSSTVKKLGLETTLQAGRFSLPHGRRPSEIMHRLTSPSEIRRIYTELTIPEGLTSSGIAKRVEEAGLARAEDVENAIRDIALDYPIKRNPQGLQGYLFPDTYNFAKPLDESFSDSEANAGIIIRAMADKFFDVLDDVDPTWKGLTPSQLHEKITLASIVEREYRVPEEAPMIAAVFNNRIIEGMPLQSCATVVYTIEETAPGRPFQDDYLRFNRRIFERYLEIDSLYNTYVNGGLPPGPISNPGRVAIESVFFPAESDALFFVVKDPAAGTHTFSRNYDDHLNARESYLNQFVVKD
ncbi:MAG: endolytic transglycosylase MltG, partial [Spirochaetaceae bacterium]|nr:endolytic transglycosylase MltG [Spirochaetaceae bacterium]